MDNYNYDVQFAGKILIAGRASCGKTTFIQKSAINNFFGELKRVEWLSYLKIDKVREAQIESYIKCPIDFHYPKNLAEFDYLTEEFNCVYIFHIIHPENAIWRAIISQTNIFNIFSTSAPFSLVKKILEINCIRKSAKYIS